MNLNDWIINNEDCNETEIIKIFLNLTKYVLSEHKKNKLVKNLCSENIIVDDAGNIIEVNSKIDNFDNNEYKAPELLETDISSKEGNIYSLGIILDQLERGNTFWNENNYDDDEFMKHIKSSNFGVDAIEESQFRDIIENFTSIDPDNRKCNIEDIHGLFKANYLLNNYINENMNETFELEDDSSDEISNEEGLESMEESNDNALNENFDDIDEDNEYEEAILEETFGREIGIDLGTSNSTIAYVENGKINTLKIKNSDVIPSVVFFNSSSSKIYGKTAINKGMQYPNSLLRTFKRHLKTNKKDIQIEFVDKERINELGSNIFVFDTNVFIDDPNVLEGISEKDEIVVSHTVIEEIGYRKSDEDTEVQAEKAEEVINRLRKKIRFEESDTDLLPKDFFKNAKSNNDNNDNKVLSVALKIKEKNPILVTSDNGLRTKADIVGIKTQTLKEFNFNKSIKSDTGNEFIKLSGQEASAIFLRYLKDEAFKKLGNVDKAVITVPANFTPFEIEATKNAGLEAGFSEIRIEKEPVAAAIAYSMDIEDKKTILVYDFGGGTFDISIIECENGKLSVLETDGDSNLGGEDLTNELINHIYDLLEEEHELSMFDMDESGLEKDKYYKNKISIYNECEKCKKDLSLYTEYEFETEVYISNEESKKNIRYSITRKQFEDIVKEKINLTKKKLDDILIKADLKANEIDTVVLAGGTSSIALIKDFVAKYFGKQPYSDKNPATLIAEGAALVANNSWSNDKTIEDKIIIFDKTINDLGVSLKGHKFDSLISVDTSLPCKNTREYSLVKDYQEELELNLFTRENGSNAKRTIDDGITSIGKIMISDLPPLIQSDATVIVEFELTKEYILDVNVSIKDINGTIIKNKNIKVKKQA